MRAVAGARSFQCSRQIQPSASLKKGAGILPPVLSIKVNGKKVAAFVQQHRIDADDESASPIIASRQVPADHFVRYGEETTVGTIGALNPRLFTNASHPLVRAGWLVACPPGLSAFKTNRINILSPAKQGSE
jgi:hypothetical protein